MKNKYQIKIIIVALVLATTLCFPTMSFAKSMDGGTDVYSGELPELQNAIAAQAIKLAWPYGGYRNYASAAYKAGLDKAYPNRSHWSDYRTREGRSCDVFTGTVVRCSGYDTAFPRALETDTRYLPNSDKFERVSISSSAEMEPGDIILMMRSSNKGHICVYVEQNNVGYIAEADFGRARVGGITRKVPNWNQSKYRTFGVYRATGDCTVAYSEGDELEGVAEIQEFLKWAGLYEGKVDGIYGKELTESVKSFQKKVGIEETGNFGSECIAAAKNYTCDKSGLQKAEQ